LPDPYQPLCVGIARPDLKVLEHLASVCQERSGLLDGAEASRNADALVALSARWRDWLRPLGDWQPPAEVADQFASLVRHLLARYDVPRFLDAAWRDGLTEDGVRGQDWFLLIGAGGSIRDAADMPIPLTKRVAHQFSQAPADLAVLTAFRYAQVLALGGDDRLARSLLRTRLAGDFDHNDFWETVIRWLVAHPEVGPEHHAAVIDYLHEQKFVASMPSPYRPGRPRVVTPPRPHLCMRGRRPESLLREAARWRRFRPARASSVLWQPSGLPPLSLPVTDAAGRKTYAITELLSAEELQEEGAAMSHCVAGYWAVCRAGTRSVWSLTVEDDEGRLARLVTLEVANAAREVVQARGRGNRPLLACELPVLRSWWTAGGPHLSAACCPVPAGA
jgi:hypothetical protein